MPEDEVCFITFKGRRRGQGGGGRSMEVGMGTGETVTYLQPYPNKAHASKYLRNRETFCVFWWVYFWGSGCASVLYRHQ